MSKVYVVLGSHGEVYATTDSEKAFELWAGTNGFDNYPDFLNEYEDSFEFSEGHWFLDEGGEVQLVELS